MPEASTSNDMDIHRRADRASRTGGSIPDAPAKPTMNHTVMSEVEREVRADEMLLWSGQPAQGLRLHRADVFLIPFSIFWAGTAILWELVMFARGAPPFLLAIGAPFIVAGMYLLVGRFFTDAYRRRRTYYGLTNQRALIVRTGSRRDVTSLDIGELDIAVNDYANGVGTIALEPVAEKWFSDSGWPGMSREMPAAFVMIPEARRVYGLIEAAQRAIGAG